jgi:Amt family ammonium transporter
VPLENIRARTGDDAWQLTAATLVGLMSVPGLVVPYGGVMQKRWSVNSMMLSFVAFALVRRQGIRAG